MAYLGDLALEDCGRFFYVSSMFPQRTDYIFTLCGVSFTSAISLLAFAIVVEALFRCLLIVHVGDPSNSKDVYFYITVKRGSDQPFSVRHSCKF